MGNGVSSTNGKIGSAQSFAVVALGGILISIPLALTGRSILGSAADLRDATQAVDAWLGEDSPYRVTDLTIDGDSVTVQLVGPGTPTPPASTVLSRLVTGRYRVDR